MSEKTPNTLRWSDFGLISLAIMAFALCGLITALVNLLGLANNSFGMIPRVEDLRGLMTSTLLLTILGMTPVAMRSLSIISQNRNQ
jgi:hypothetical protein